MLLCVGGIALVLFIAVIVINILQVRTSVPIRTMCLYNSWKCPLPHNKLNVLLVPAAEETELALVPGAALVGLAATVDALARAPRPCLQKNLLLRMLPPHLL